MFSTDQAVYVSQWAAYCAGRKAFASGASIANPHLVGSPERWAFERGVRDEDFDQRRQAFA